MEKVINDNPIMGCYNCPFKSPLSQFGDGAQPGFYCNHPDFVHLERPMVLKPQSVSMEHNEIPQTCPLKQKAYEVIYRYRLVR